MKEMICIVCPKGCHLNIDESTLAVNGNGCPRGAEYARTELTAPVRVLTSTVRLVGGELERCPVRTDRAVPRDRLSDIMAEIHRASVTHPVHIGDTVISDVCGTGADVIVTRNL